MVGCMSATAHHPPEKPDLDEVVQQIDFLTTDLGRIDRTLRHIRVATMIIAIPAALTILAFLLWFLFLLVGLGLSL